MELACIGDRSRATLPTPCAPWIRAWPVAGLLLPLLVTAAQGTRLLVPQEFASISAAITAATNSDTVLVQPGVYQGALRFEGKKIRVTSIDPEDPAIVAATQISSEGVGGAVVAFDAGEDSSSVLTGFTLSDGEGRYWGGTYYGAGIYVDAAPTIAHCYLRDNRGRTHSSIGGGIYVAPGAHLRLFDSVLESNGQRTLNGGAIYMDQGATALLQRCRVGVNKGFSEIEGDGAQLTMEECEIRDKIRLDGGALSLRDCILRGENAGVSVYDGCVTWVENCLFKGAGNGGLHASDGTLTALDCRFQSLDDRPLALTSMERGRITRCIIGGTRSNWSQVFISNNSGVGCSGAPILFTQCIFFDNQDLTSSDLGLIEIRASEVVFEQCSIFGNERSGDDPIISIRADTGPSAINIYNSIIWGNQGSSLAADDPELVTVTYSDIQGGWPGQGNIDADPLFSSSYQWPGLLLSGSPAIDAGDPLSRDQISDWHPRWPAELVDGPRADMGALGGPANGLWWDSAAWNDAPDSPQGGPGRHEGVR
jgi:hypothetical protein